MTARNTSDSTALHLAAENNLPSICSILLAEEIDFGAVDNRGNNALHLAVKEGHLQVIRVLLTESQIDAEAINNKSKSKERKKTTNRRLVRLVLFSHSATLYISYIF